jgi:hypothetical protein
MAHLMWRNKGWLSLELGGLATLNFSVPETKLGISGM